MEKPNNGVGERITRIRTLRSCMACRTRKVKCDRAKPCTACQRNQLQCVYPEQTPRAPRPRRPDAELLERIARLEHVIESMPAENHPDLKRKRSQGPEDASTTTPESTKSTPSEASTESRPGQNGYGHLIKTGEGKLRYIGQTSWASLSDEVAEIKELFNAESADANGQFSSVFFHSAAKNLTEFHPPPQMGFHLYQTYVVAVDPLVRILHKGQFEEKYAAFQQALAAGTTDMHDGFEALVFAVYYAAVLSMHPETVFTRYGVEKQALMNHYRFALEHALSNANFLHCEEIDTLRALMLFVFFLRHQGDTATSWSLIGLVIRIAQSLGLHRDSSHFDLKPIDAEVRRRLWYELCLLDARIAEDHGAESTISAMTYDTKKPLNLNDADLTEELEVMPEPRSGFTEMTFALLRLDFIDCFRSLADPSGTDWAKMSLREKDNMIEELRAKVREKYLQSIDISQPMQACFLMASRMVTSKAKLFLYHQYRNSWNGQTLSDEMKTDLFTNAVETLEGTIELATHSASQPWHWYFRGFHQAHAIALILLELCVNPVGPLSDKAWAAVETFTGSKDLFGTGSPENSKRIWKPLSKLKERAMRARLQVQSQSSSVNAADGTDGSAETFDDSYAFDPLNNSPIDWREWDNMFQYVTV